MSRLHLGTAFLSLTVVLVACSSDRPTEKLGETTQDIQGGTTDATHSFVVGVCGGLSGGQCQLTCSGALILPNMVISARHCVENTSEMIDCATSKFGARLAPPSGYIVTTAPGIVGAAAKQHVVSQIITPAPTEVCGNDISILILKDMIPSSEAVPAIPNTGYSLTDQDHYNSNAGFTAIGYGITSPNGNDSGTRRIRKNIDTVCIPGDCAIDCKKLGAPANEFTDNEFLGGDGTCQGDSGSSAWMQNQFDSNTFVSMGVLSRGGVSMDGASCVGSIYTRVDSWRDLIVQSAVTASANWTKYPKPTPDWTVYAPPPACPTSGPAKKDAGAGGAFGATCSLDSQCASKKCHSGGGKSYCTQACTAGDTAGCPSGYECDPAALVCVVGAPAAADDGGTANHATSTTTTTSGCAIGPAPDPSKPVPWKTLGIALAGALGLIVRRRRSR
jgi:MYXO-CTERM domain-containing protein